jgi:DNA-binding transcriptional LysR family regulator
MCVVLREGHPLLLRRSLRLADLADAGWVLPGPEVLARRRLEARLAEQGLPAPRVVVQMDSTVALVPSVLRGSDLLAVMSRFSVAPAGAAGLAVLPLADASWRRRVGIVTRRGSYLSPLAGRFMELLQERARTLAATLA